MVGIVRKKYMTVVLQGEVEASYDALEACHGRTDFISRCTGNLCECHGGDAVFDVDADGNAQFHVGDIAEGRNEVKHNVTATDAYVFGMEVAFVA